ncbi:MAG: acyl carrier protein [Deltaproteobacteria bacterium]
MASEDVAARVREIMAGLFALDPSEINDASAIDTVEKWDSLQHVNLLMALEQEFDIIFDVDDAASMISYPEVCEALGRYIAAK